MLPITVRKVLRGSRGFTLAEVLIAAIIGTMVIASAWSVYVMVWQWWTETSPRLDVERTARLALLNVTEGVKSVKGLSGDVAGSYTAGATAYKRRNGIAWATGYPAISVDGKTITYKLVPDTAPGVSRQFYYGTHNGQGALYYKHSSGTSYLLDSTLGITDIKFEKFEDADHNVHDNIIKVTVTAAKAVYGTRVQQPYTVRVVYTDTVYLRNAL